MKFRTTRLASWSEESSLHRSLAVEEQFYVTLPLVIYFSRGYRYYALFCGRFGQKEWLRSSLCLVEMMLCFSVSWEQFLCGLELLTANRRVLQFALGVLLARYGDSCLAKRILGHDPNIRLAELRLAGQSVCPLLRE